MIMAAIQLAKAYDETPEAVAVVRQQTGTPKRQYPYVEYQPGMSPLQIRLAPPFLDGPSQRRDGRAGPLRAARVPPVSGQR